MRPRDLVAAVPDPSEPTVAPDRVRGQDPFHRRPAKWLTQQLLGCLVDLARLHRPLSPLEYQRDSLEYRARLGRRGMRLSRVPSSVVQEPPVELTQLGKLNLESRVRTCPA